MADTTAPSSPIKISWFIAILAAFFLFALIAFYSARMVAETPNYDAQRREERLANLAKLREADRQTLSTVDWVDQSKGTVRIPIDEAMSEEVIALKIKPVQVGSALPNMAPSATNNPIAANPSKAGSAAANTAPMTGSSSPTKPNK